MRQRSIVGKRPDSIPALFPVSVSAKIQRCQIPNRDLSWAVVLSFCFYYVLFI